MYLQPDNSPFKTMDFQPWELVVKVRNISLVVLHSFGFLLGKKRTPRIIPISIIIQLLSQGMLIMGLFLPGCATSCHVGGLFSGFLVALLVARRSGYRSALLPWPFLMMLLVLMPYGRRVVSLGEIDLQSVWMMRDWLKHLLEVVSSQPGLGGWRERKRERESG